MPENNSAVAPLRLVEFVVPIRASVSSARSVAASCSST